MKKIALSTLIIALIGIAFFFQQQESNQITPEEEIVSGAYEALNFMGARQGAIPENAFYAAWENNRNMPEATTVQRDDPEPWESMGPHNKGGRTLALALNPQNDNTIWAGSASGGLWKTTTGGFGTEAWEQVPTGFPVLAVSSIAIHPQDSMTMFIGTGEVYNYFEAGTGAAYRSTRGSFGMGILKSTDGGETWEISLDWSYNQERGIWAVKFAPSNPNILYAATTEGVYKSVDSGVNWTQVQDVIMANDLLIHPDDENLVLVGCGNFGTEGKGIYRTTNGGDSWTPITENIPDDFQGKIQFGMAPSQPNTVYASIGNGFSSSTGATWLLRSNDFGANFELRSTTDYSRWQGWFSHDVAVSPTNPDHIICIGIQVWKSVTAGNTLLLKTVGGIGYDNPAIEGPYGDPDFVHSDAHDVIYHPTDPNILFIASDGGFTRSDDGGETYQTLNGRYQTVQFYNGFSNSRFSNTFAIGGLQDNGTISWNGDLTWRGIWGGDGSWTAASPDDAGTFYVSSQNLNMRKTENGGDGFFGTGVPIEGAVSFIAPFVVAPSDGNVVYAGSAVVAKTTNGTDSWTVTNGGNFLSSDLNPVLSMEVSPQNADVVYVATAPLNGVPGSAYVTTDGETWTEIPSNLPTSRYPMDMTVDPTDEAVAYVTYSGFGTGHVFRTEDYGQTWVDITGDLPDVPTNAVIVDPLFPNNVYVGNDLGLYVSADYGETWSTYQDGLPDAVMAFDLKISPLDRKLRVATHGNGAYQRDLLEEPIVSTEEIVLKSLNLRVFPNPVQTQATVQFELEEKLDLNFQLLNASGQLVQQLQDGQFVNGQHQFELNAGDLPKGIYYIRVSSGKGQRMEKILLQ